MKLLVEDMVESVLGLVTTELVDRKKVVAVFEEVASVFAEVVYDWKLEEAKK